MVFNPSIISLITSFIHILLKLMWIYRRNVQNIKCFLQLIFMKYYEGGSRDANHVTHENRTLSKTATHQTRFHFILLDNLKKSGKAIVFTDYRMASSIKKQQILLRIMRDYTEFPPLKYFIRVLKTCPKSALLYTQIWKKKGKHMSLQTQKRDVRKEYLISPTMFRNLLAPLMFLNLISFVESDERFQIDILGPGNNE